MTVRDRHQLLPRNYRRLLAYLAEFASTPVGNPCTKKIKKVKRGSGLADVAPSTSTNSKKLTAPSELLVQRMKDVYIFINTHTQQGSKIKMNKLQYTTPY